MPLRRGRLIRALELLEKPSNCKIVGLWVDDVLVAVPTTIYAMQMTSRSSCRDGLGLLERHDRVITSVHDKQWTVQPRCCDAMIGYAHATQAQP